MHQGGGEVGVRICIHREMLGHELRALPIPACIKNGGHGGGNMHIDGHCLQQQQQQQQVLLIQAHTI